ncbi:hypothetical protein FJT64_022158 [Amphibalanus amphitrite]|uniref:G-protein coupled receptors family 1 profile domain-containing protein n=1 Tax=Amphibalanus amphitrite TaxID=1232801 RepID=A0A6A4WVZ4_AMPAM|nr:hypothetical protein FJT64_022158 [Amphibalanus amphitrite]
MELLLCYVTTQPDNSTRDVCQLRSSEDDDDPTAMYAVFISVVVFSVFMAITLNLMQQLPLVTGVEEAARAACGASSPTPKVAWSSKDAISRSSENPAPSTSAQSPVSVDRPANTAQKHPIVPRVTLTGVPPIGRVDIVATMALVAFLATFFISFAPYIAVVHYKLLRANCITMPGTRYVLFSLVISSGGITAICTPLVCVIFSRDFRQAFRRTCSRFRHYICG